MEMKFQIPACVASIDHAYAVCLPGDQVTARLGFFLYSTNLGVWVDHGSLLYRLNLLAAP